MKDILSKFKIPTLLGLAILIFGIGAGIFLTLKDQTFISKASPDVTIQNLTISNIEDNSATISWQTSSSSVSFISFGINSSTEQTALDDRDEKTPKAHLVHYFTLKNLLPKTLYQYKITSGRSSQIGTFTSAAPLTSQNGFKPIIGNVLNGDIPLDEGVVYLSIPDTGVESALIRESGNFLIPISQIRKEDLSEGFPLTEDSTVKLTILSLKGEAMILFKLKDAYEGLPPIKLGENLDLTTNQPSNIADYDLNEDGKINANDNAILVQNFGKNPKNSKADLNSDGVVDQKDMELLSKQINQ